MVIVCTFFNCETTFKSYRGMSSHHIRVHNFKRNERRGVFRCDRCSRQFETPSDLENHMNKNHKPEFCPQCHRKFLYLVSWHAHQLATNHRWWKEKKKIK